MILAIQIDSYFEKGILEPTPLKIPVFEEKQQSAQAAKEAEAPSCPNPRPP